MAKKESAVHAYKWIRRAAFMLLHYGSHLQHPAETEKAQHDHVIVLSFPVTLPTHRKKKESKPTR
ncbi:hypothetical protein DBR44_00030 [Aquitalea sp. FJL05]|uniref:hypothetical protein n=1 Tax=Aquitalea sp. FJL05 TaxID=2153366 RepID=UPI000F5999D7|nr:hypothetical protein [Aquitalea sp. FJL05]RQO78182.1 hypothetical protein DBR44_00030 [Aquitalea sp. FJL05]